MVRLLRGSCLFKKHLLHILPKLERTTASSVRLSPSQPDYKSYPDCISTNIRCLLMKHINLSIESGIFPSSCKWAIVLLKVGRQNDPINYRLVSLLSVFRCNFEKKRAFSFTCFSRGKWFFPWFSIWFLSKTFNKACMCNCFEFSSYCAWLWFDFSCNFSG